MNLTKTLFLLCSFCTTSLAAWQATSPDLMGEGIKIDSKDSLLLTRHPSELIYGNTSHSISSFYIAPDFKYVYSEHDTLLFALDQNNLKIKMVDTRTRHILNGDAHFYSDRGTVKLASVRGKQFEFVKGKPRKKKLNIKDKTSNGYSELTFEQYLVKNIEDKYNIRVEVRKNGKRVRLYEIDKRKHSGIVVHDDFYRKLQLFSHKEYLYIFDAVNIKLITFDKDLRKVGEYSLQHPSLSPLIGKHRRLAASPDVYYARLIFLQDDIYPDQLYFFMKESGALHSVDQDAHTGELSLSKAPIMIFKGRLRQIYNDKLYFLVEARPREFTNLYNSLFQQGRIINYIYSARLKDSQ